MYAEPSCTFHFSFYFHSFAFFSIFFFHPNVLIFRLNLSVFTFLFILIHSHYSTFPISQSVTFYHSKLSSHFSPFSLISITSLFPFSRHFCECFSYTLSSRFTIISSPDLTYMYTVVSKSVGKNTQDHTTRPTGSMGNDIKNSVMMHLTHNIGDWWWLLMCV